MEQHRFKVVHSSEDEVYRILDLTDSSIVGITEMYETDDEWEREERIKRTKELKEKKGYGAKVVGYGIIIVIDVHNTAINELSTDDKYIRSVLRQMAAYFKEKVIEKKPEAFECYRLPQRQRIEKSSERSSQALVAVPTNAKKPSEDKGLWGRLHPAIKVVLAVLGVAAYVALVVFVGLGVLALLAFLLFLPALNKKTKW